MNKENKISGLYWEVPKLKPLDDNPRHFELMRDFETHIILRNNEIISYYAKEGTRSDGRSGGQVVDLILPHSTKEHDIQNKYVMTWWLHDLAFNLGACGTPVGYHEANDYYYQLMRWSHLCWIRSRLAYRGVESSIGEECFHEFNDYDGHNENLIDIKRPSELPFRECPKHLKFNKLK